MADDGESYQGSEQDGQIPLGVHSFQLKGQAELLDAIDRVRALGVGYEIPLPQLIVVGDQSSGKSSVLEAISGLRFPVDQGTTTRFATEIILRHSDETFAEIRILPGPGRTLDDKAFRDSFVAGITSLEDLPRLIGKAKETIGLDKGFSKDILQLHISDPRCPHLSLVDLPGLIRNPEEGRTMEDKKTVLDLVKRYMAEPRSIILAVVTADSDPEIVEVLALAREADPTGWRTMGIITKPDLAKAGSNSVKKYVSRAKAEQKTFRLGWHVVRNGDFDERNRDDFDRDREETENLSKPPWSQLPPTHRGIESLKSRLSKCLLDLIRFEMPALIAELESAKHHNDQALLKMGHTRASPNKQREFLTAISVRYQELVRNGSDARYNDSFFTDGFETERKLRKVIRDTGESFGKGLIINTGPYKIHWLVQQDDLKQAIPPKSDSLFIHKDSDGNALVPASDLLLNRIRSTLVENRGWEMGSSYNPSVVIPPVFKSMTAHWPGLARQYGLASSNHTRKFLKLVLKQTCDEPGPFTLIWEGLIEEDLMRRTDRLLAKLEELAAPYTRTHPFTFSKRMNDMTDTILRRLDGDGVFGNGMLFINESDLSASKQVFAQVQALYQIALEHFVDNCALLGVENEFLAGLEDVLSPARISSLSDKQLAELAAESPESQSRRTHLEKLKVDFDEALKICKLNEKLGRVQRPTSSIRDELPRDTAINRGSQATDRLSTIPRTRSDHLSTTSRTSSSPFLAFENMTSQPATTASGELSTNNFRTSSSGIFDSSNARSSMSSSRSMDPGLKTSQFNFSFLQPAPGNPSSLSARP